MKLSKRIGLTYIIGLGISICFCISFFTVFINASREGERLRSAEISKGVRERMFRKSNEIQEECNLYKSLIDSQDDNFIKILSEGELERNAKIDFSGVVNLDTGIVSNIFKDEAIDSTTYSDVLGDIIQYIKTEDYESKNGVIIVNDKNYIVSYSKLKGDSNYVVLIRNMDKTFLDDIGMSTGSSTYITKELGEDLNGYSSDIDNVTYVFEEDEDDIYSYSSIDVLNGNETLYLKVGQYKQVESTITVNFIILVSIIFIILITINVGLYVFINKRVVKRIIFVNDSVHKVAAKEDSNKRVNIMGIKDEITDLSVSINDMLDRVNHAKVRLEDSENKYSGIINTMTNGFVYCRLIVKDNELDGKIVDINDAAKDILNVEKWENESISSIFEGFKKSNQIILETINKLKDKSHLVIDKEVELPNNRWGSMTVTMIEKGFFFIIINDVTKIKLYSEEMTYLANYDSLTDIYNRRKLLNYIEELEKEKRSYNFLYMDLDDFKNINDTLGHDKGDYVLKDISNRLTTLASDNVKIARLGGDEFAIVMEGSFEEQEILDFGNRVIEIMNKNYKFDEFKYDAKVSIGVSRYPNDGKDVNTVIKYADIAMYNSKLKGGNIISIFNEEIFEMHELENKIKEGMSKGEFIPYFQPIYNIKANKVDGVEALVRWNSKSGILTPDKFLDVAKSKGLIVEIDKKMFKEACILNSEWRKRNGEFAFISINISNSLLIRKDFLNFILETIELYNIPTEYIKLEITEDELIKDLQSIVPILNCFRDVGIKIALDDFGAGYSSYNYINTLPIDVMKIDRSLIMNIEKDKKSLAIVDSLIQLSKSLEIETICEGIENKAQLEILSKLGCDKIQGFVFSKPLSEGEIFNYIDNFEI